MKQRTSIMISPEIKKRVDKLAKENGRSFSQQLEYMAANTAKPLFSYKADFIYSLAKNISEHEFIKYLKDELSRLPDTVNKNEFKIRV